MISPRVEAILADLGIAQTFITGRGLPECIEACTLEVVATDPDGREYLLTPEAAAAWRAMQAAALEDGIELQVVSAFRSIDRQTEIIRRKLAAGQCIDDILCVSAPPGFSEHHTGRAVDIGTPGSPALETAFEQTAAFAWLIENAGRFGFRMSYPENNRWGYQYEPWHWCHHVA